MSSYNGAAYLQCDVHASMDLYELVSVPDQQLVVVVGQSGKKLSQLVKYKKAYNLHIHKY